VNIQDRITKLEKELAELKESVGKKEMWFPRKGEIIRVTDNKEDWAYTRFAEYKKDYYYDDNGDFWMYAEPLNDPMVIQLIPHVPGDEMPCDFDSDVIVLHGNDFSKRYYTVDSAKNISWDRFDSNDDVFGWKHLNED